MAALHAVGTLTLALVGLLDQAKSRIDVPGLKVEALQANRLKDGPTGGVGVSLFLHRMTVSTARRNLPPRVTSDGKRLRAPLPLDVYYLVTAWAKKPEVQHYLLTWAMSTLDELSTLSASVLNGFDPTHRPFHEDETVGIVFDPISIPDMLTIWEVGKPNIQPSVGYVARVVPIDSATVEPAPPPVQSRSF
jgi:hypothetical protein